MKIEVWSDFTCPLCYIGKRHLEEALKRFNYADQVTIEYKSYELSPNQAVELSGSSHQTLAETFNMSTERAKVMREDTQRQALAVGLNYDFEQMQPANTFDAHRLAKYALKKQKNHDIIERLLRAYFVEGAHISNPDILIQLATDVGLDSAPVAELLSTNKYESSVRCDQIEAEQIGVETIPFFVFDEEYAVSGVQSSDVFVDVLEQVWAEFRERQPDIRKRPGKSETSYCSGGDCSQNDG